MAGLALLLVLAALCVAALPIWPHSRPWGAGPSRTLALLLFLALLLWRLGLFEVGWRGGSGGGATTTPAAVPAIAATATP